MKKIKLLVLFVCLFLLSGCDAVYNMEIGRTIKEELIVRYNDSEYVEFKELDSNKYVAMYFNDSNNKLEDGIEPPLENVKYYDFKEDSALKTVTFSGSIRQKDYWRSSIVKSGFKTVDIVYSKDEIHLKTSKGFLRDDIDSVTINIKSNYKVMSSTADVAKGDVLTWIINSSNRDTKQIVVDYSIEKESSTTKNESNPYIKPTEEKEETSITENITDSSNLAIVIVVGSVVLLALLLFIAYKVKTRKNSKI